MQYGVTALRRLRVKWSGGAAPEAWGNLHGGYALLVWGLLCMACGLHAMQLELHNATEALADLLGEMAKLSVDGRELRGDLN